MAENVGMANEKETAILYTSFGGLYIWTGETGILIDGAGYCPDGNTLTQETSELYGHIDGLLFMDQGAHEHMENLMHRLLPHQPHIHILGPIENIDTPYARAINEEAYFLRLRDILILAIQSHEQTSPLPTYISLLLHAGKKTFFISGKGMLSNSQAEKYADFFGNGIDAAFLNAEYSNVDRYVGFLPMLAPKRIYLCSPVRRTSHRSSHELPEPEIVRPESWIGGKRAIWGGTDVQH